MAYGSMSSYRVICSVLVHYLYAPVSNPSAQYCKCAVGHFTSMPCAGALKSLIEAVMHFFLLLQFDIVTRCQFQI